MIILKSKIQIPIVLQKILKLNDLDNVGICSKINDETITEVEIFMKTIFDQDMISANETIDEYLGIFHKSQQKFQFTTGQKHLIKIIRDSCEELLGQPKQNMTINIDTGPSLTILAIQTEFEIRHST